MLNNGTWSHSHALLCSTITLNVRLNKIAHFIFSARVKESSKAKKLFTSTRFYYFAILIRLFIILFILIIYKIVKESGRENSN
jgi:hypothetical protein